ncbi:hypothetical protein EV694_1965 [Volucribacter psittacicida]|uniref:Uncharacterized protein n=1 Tax=Volucribacter psittacicida TaxID=203482 RepID=A0A4R1FQT0_9PAST|nr:hypothetical protein [Volucribacter psittacicida]TCJ95962.1 hypothetical protein EV694_1965 [Volucribacter psittacicida]
MKKMNMDRIQLIAKTTYFCAVGGFALWFAFYLMTALPVDASMLTLSIFAFIYTFIWALVVGLLGVTLGYVVAALSFLFAIIMEWGYGLYKRT